LRSEILTICDDAARALGFKPRCDLRGPIDTLVAETRGDQLLLCLREVLSNVARHAQATSVDVDVVVDRSHLALRVTDDGVGYEPTPGARTSGLDNMLARAESAGGRFHIGPGQRGGTVVTWDVPLAPFEDDPGDDGSRAPT
jgi:signal transduction histidine kinase